MSRRQVKTTVIGSQQVDGAGVKLRRVLGHTTVKDFDPFLMLDFFDSKNPDDYMKGFPWHPHRGIETITYLIHGEMEHGDSLGNKGVIKGGCCQWMTAGSGIIHQELPAAAPHMLGVQLWLNLSQKNKMVEPTYRNIQEIPKVDDAGAHVHVISGHYKSTGEAGKLHSGAVQGGYSKMLYLDVELEPNIEWKLDTDPAETLFVYIVSGSMRFDENGELFKDQQAVLFDSGSELYVKAGDEGARILICASAPLREPVAWGGPIVMNTREELHDAFRELDEDKFIKHN
jgi:redox-sensitive bicupin YhaK (pirin superfamily)